MLKSLKDFTHYHRTQQEGYTGKKSERDSRDEIECPFRDHSFIQYVRKIFRKTNILTFSTP